MTTSTEGDIRPNRKRILTPPLLGRVYVKPKTGYNIKNIVRYDSFGRIIDGQNISANKYVEVISADGGFCRIVLCKTDEDSIISIDEDVFEVYYNFSDNIIEGSFLLNEKWLKNTTFGNPSSDLFKGGLADYTFGGRNTSTSDIYSMFDSLVGNYIIKENIGMSSDNQPLYCYKTNPIEYNLGSYAYQKRPPKILIIAGQHGFEKSSIYGLYYLLKELNENYNNSSVLRYIRQFVRLIIVPCANPYGIDNFVYKNANGVNLNRNWDSYNWDTDKVTDIESPEYGGVKPFDQPETSAFLNVINSNPDICLIIDAHTNGGGKVSKQNINWLNLPDVNIDAYSSRILSVCKYHLSNISLWLNSEYSEYIGGIITEPCGYISSSAIHAGTLASYTAMINTYGVTLEVFNGFPNDDDGYENNLVKKACSELIGNFISAFCNIINQP